MPTNQDIYDNLLESPKLEECVDILDSLVDSGEEDVSWYFIRARKVILSVNKTLPLIDPDLIPNKNLQNLNGHINAIHAVLILPDPSASIKANHATPFHNALEAIVATILPFVADGGFRDQVRAEAYSEIFNSQKEKIKSLMEEAKELRKKIDSEYKSAGSAVREIEEIKERVDDYDTEVFGDDDTEGLRTELQRKLEEIDAIYNKVTVFDDKFHHGNEEENGIRQRILNARDEAESDRNEIKDTVVFHLSQDA